MVTPIREALGEGRSAAGVHAEVPRVQVSVEDMKSDPVHHKLTIYTFTQNVLILWFNMTDNTQCICVC